METQNQPTKSKTVKVVPNKKKEKNVEIEFVNKKTDYQAIIETLHGDRELTSQETLQLSSAIKASKSLNEQQNLITNSKIITSDNDDENSYKLPVTKSTKDAIDDIHIESSLLDTNSFKLSVTISNVTSSTNNEMNKNSIRYSKILMVIVDAYVHKLINACGGYMFSTVIYEAMLIGPPELHEICKSHNIDVRDVLKNVIKDPKITKHINLTIHEKFINVRFFGGRSELDPKSDAFFDRLAEYDRSSMYVLKNNHAIPEHIDKTHFAYTFDRVHIHNCKCIRCVKLMIVDKFFLQDITILFTEDPYENLIRLEKYLFTIISAGVLKDFFEKTSYKFINKTMNNPSGDINTNTIKITPFNKVYEHHLRALAYLNKNKNSVSENNSKQYDHFSKLFKNDQNIEPAISQNSLKSNDFHVNKIKDPNYRDVMFYLPNNSHRMFFQSPSNLTPDCYGLSRNILISLIICDNTLENILMQNMNLLHMTNSIKSKHWCSVDAYLTLKTNSKKYDLVAHHSTFVKYYHNCMSEKIYTHLLDNGYANIDELFHGDTMHGLTFKKSSHKMYDTQKLHIKKKLFMFVMCFNDRHETLNHNFIDFVMKEFKMPHDIHFYVKEYYSKLKVRIFDSNNKSDYFRMEKGLLKGDVLSDALIFMCTIYIMRVIMKKLNVNITTFITDFVAYVSEPKLITSIVYEIVKFNNTYKTGISLNFADSYIFSNLDQSTKDWVIPFKNNKKTIKFVDNKNTIVYRFTGSIFYDHNEETVDNLYKGIVDSFEYAENEMIKKNILILKSNTHKNPDIDINRTEHYSVFFGRVVDNIFDAELYIDNEEELHHENEDYDSCEQQDLLRKLFDQSNALNDDRESIKDTKELIIQEVFWILTSHIKYIIITSMMNIDTMYEFVNKINVIASNYLLRWRTKAKKQYVSYFVDFIDVYTRIQTVLNCFDNEFNRVINNMVNEIYQKTFIPELDMYCDHVQSNTL